MHLIELINRSTVETCRRPTAHALHGTLTLTMGAVSVSRCVEPTNRAAIHAFSSDGKDTIRQKTFHDRLHVYD